MLSCLLLLCLAHTDNIQLPVIPSSTRVKWPRRWQDAADLVMVIGLAVTVFQQTLFSCLNPFGKQADRHRQTRKATRTSI